MSSKKNWKVYETAEGGFNYIRGEVEDSAPDIKSRVVFTFGADGKIVFDVATKDSLSIAKKLGDIKEHNPYCG